MITYPLSLQPSLSRGATIQEAGPGTWRLSLPGGEADHYRLAQLDDYSRLPRRDFLRQPPLRLSLQARTSFENVPGTWGFGLWNDPFSMGRLSGTGLLRLPALPDTAWFFFASPPNYLSLRDDLPAQGGLAGTFSSPRWAGWLLPLGVLALPLLALPPAARLLRRLARRIVRQDAVQLAVDPNQWHTYAMQWESEQVRCSVDGALVLKTAVTPRGRLGLVIWIDNQYLSFTPDGRFRYGLLACPEPAWLEVGEISLSQG
jgi:hypothetical protein